MEEMLYARSGDTAFLIEQKPDGIFLFSFLPNGFVGDTWHQSIDEAKAQADYEAGAAIGSWEIVSAEFQADLYAKSKILSSQQ